MKKLAMGIILISVVFFSSVGQAGLADDYYNWGDKFGSTDYYRHKWQQEEEQQRREDELQQQQDRKLEELQDELDSLRRENRWRE